MTYRILSIDGGGVRGILALRLLQRLAAESNRPNFMDQIDLFAGTSTGGIIALGMASGLTPEEGRRLYETMIPFVFADSLWDDLKDIGFAIGAKYSSENRKHSLASQFGESRLDDLPRKVLISTFDLDNEGQSQDGIRRWKPKFFHNYPGPDSDGDQLVADVAMRTSAAPIYFPVYQGYIDGGVVANNPSMCALAQVLDEKFGGQQPTDVVLFSLGTGQLPQYLTVKDADWGWKQWSVHLTPEQGIDLPLLDIMMSGSSGVADFQCRRVLNDQYHRLQPILPEPIGMDAVNAMERLVQIADSIELSETIDWLTAHFDA